MAEKKAKDTATAKPAKGSALRFHVVQQGSRYSVVESDTGPDLKTERGERTKVGQGSYPTREEAESRAAALAEHFQGEVA